MSSSSGVVLVVSLVLALSSGCDSNNPGGDGDPDGGGGGGGGACGDAPDIALDTWVERTAPGTGGRKYFVRLPAGYDPDREYPVIYQLHGCSSGRETNNVPIEGQSGSDAINVRGRAAGECWDTTTDVPYFDAMVADVDASFCTDTSRRLISGYSSGAFFAHRLACIRGDSIRGIATIAGGSPGGGCVGQVAVLQIHDQDDQTVMITPVGYPTRNFWVTANHCEMTSEATDHPPCVEYDGCDADFPVVWCETSGEDHSRQDALAAPIFWDFLSSL